MTRFLCAENGDLINANQIARIEADGNRRSKAILHDGKTVRLIDTLNSIDQLAAPLIAATPGFAVLDYCDSKEPVVLRVPVIAWRVAGDFVTPVTPVSEVSEMLTTPNDECAILLPDGQVVQPGDQIFPNEESWREAKSRRKQEAGQRARSNLSIVPGDKP